MTTQDRDSTVIFSRSKSYSVERSNASSGPVTAAPIASSKTRGLPMTKPTTSRIRSAPMISITRQLFTRSKIMNHKKYVNDTIFDACTPPDIEDDLKDRRDLVRELRFFKNAYQLTDQENKSLKRQLSDPMFPRTGKRTTIVIDSDVEDGDGEEVEGSRDGSNPDSKGSGHVAMETTPESPDTGKDTQSSSSGRGVVNKWKTDKMFNIVKTLEETVETLRKELNVKDSKIGNLETELRKQKEACDQLAKSFEAKLSIQNQETVDNLPTKSKPDEADVVEMDLSSRSKSVTPDRFKADKPVKTEDRFVAKKPVEKTEDRFATKKPVKKTAPEDRFATKKSVKKTEDRFATKKSVKKDSFVTKKAALDNNSTKESTKGKTQKKDTAWEGGISKNKNQENDPLEQLLGRNLQQLFGKSATSQQPEPKKPAEKWIASLVRRGAQLFPNLTEISYLSSPSSMSGVFMGNHVDEDGMEL